MAVQVSGPPPSPSRLQSVLATALLVCLSLLLAPLTLVPTVACAFYSRLFKRTFARSRALPTVLVTGSRTTKALVMARAFARRGHRVCLADEGAWHAWSAARWSRSAWKAGALPDATSDTGNYIATVAKLLIDEDVALWVPCSSAAATVADAKAALVARFEGWQGRAVIQHFELAKTLHEKDLFTRLCRQLDMPGVPEGHPVSDAASATGFLFAQGAGRYILKAIGYGDDVGRSDLTVLPLETEEETLRYLRPRFAAARRREGPKPSGSAPFVLQQFLPGREYCVHAYFSPSPVRADPPELRGFVCARSSDMLMRYADVRSAHESQIQDRRAGEKAEEWSKEFMRRLAAKWERDGRSSDELEGHYSFDFMADDRGELFVIECNPRVHTAITLFRSLPAGALATAYLRSAHDHSPMGTLVPPPSEPAHVWLCHALPLSLCSLVPLGLRGLLPFLHPLLPPPTTAPPATTSPPPDGTSGPYGSSGPVQVLRRVLADGVERDAVWDAEDPWPWWHVAHVQWPAWLLWTALKGQGWSRVNVSTGRVFAT